MIVLQAQAIDVRLGGRLVLEHVNLALAQGEVLGLIGPNGAGKSTLIKLLAGLIAPDAGRVLIESQGRLAPLGDLDRLHRARSISYFPQAADVHWPVSVEALAALGRLPHRGGGFDPWNPARDERDTQAVDRALAAADVTALRHADVTRLSAGERARALLARALAVEAPILLADEPVAALDPAHQLGLMQLLRRFARAGGGVVVVLHDLNLAARYCDRLILLHQGRVQGDGPPEAVLTLDALRSAFGIVAEFGRRDGAFFVLPWETVETLSSPSPEEAGARGEAKRGGS